MVDFSEQEKERISELNRQAIRLLNLCRHDQARLSRLVNSLDSLISQMEQVDFKWAQPARSVWVDLEVLNVGRSLGTLDENAFQAELGEALDDAGKVFSKYFQSTSGE